MDAGAGNVVVIVQMRYVGVAGNEGAAAYEAISTSPSAVTGKTMVVPLVLKRLPNGFATVVTIQNIDLVDAAIVDLVYKPSFTECPVSSCDMNHDGLVNELDTITVSDVNIPAGASVQRNHRLPSGSVDAEDTLPDNWTGSLTVTSSTTNINGFVQITKYMGVVGDTFMAHDAFVLTLP